MIIHFNWDVFSENVMCNKNLYRESVLTTVFSLCTLCNGCTGNTAGMLNCDHEFVSGLNADQFREIHTLLLLESC